MIFFFYHQILASSSQMFKTESSELGYSSKNMKK